MKPIKTVTLTERAIIVVYLIVAAIAFIFGFMLGTIAT